MNLEIVDCIVFDFGRTLSSDFYFNVNPPGIPNWSETIQQALFADPPLVNRWMRNEISLEEIAARFAPQFDMPVEEAVEWSIKGCQQVTMNLAVWQFAESMKRDGKQIALVTGNMDVFNRYIRPNHNLDALFPVIINSCDYGELDKAILWPHAFAQFDVDIGYANSLLIEDSLENVELFRSLGGQAYQYSNDTEFQKVFALTD